MKVGIEITRFTSINIDKPDLDLYTARVSDLESQPNKFWKACKPRVRDISWNEEPFSNLKTFSETKNVSPLGGLTKLEQLPYCLLCVLQIREWPSRVVQIDRSDGQTWLLHIIFFASLWYSSMFFVPLADVWSLRESMKECHQCEAWRQLVFSEQVDFCAFALIWKLRSCRFDLVFHPGLVLGKWCGKWKPLHQMTI